VLYCQKYTLTDRFFGDFAHWEGTNDECHQYILMFTYLKEKTLTNQMKSFAEMAVDKDYAVFKFVSGHY